ncbi:helix-turn-helix domain-containing protein [Paenibacillus sp. LMG 31461]|uniref:Helix-turn-helix domain-containing protein n=1 Tax=Paenibacillus plantarum TaxID=2654975 RepID=A0ABX1X365_9BACL|nr:AraC family transcriptional regulator [Paenibacillus plantarum]NOU62849.1 helix-turn-helix domain-containing protein [Paenibacillus plantarum]
MSLEDDSLEGLHSEAFMMEHKDKDNYPVAFHTHIGYELVRVQSGEAWVILEDEVISIGPNSLLLFQGHIIHKVKRRSTEPYERDMIHFLSDFVPDWDEEGSISIRDQLAQTSVPYCHLRLSVEESEVCERLFASLYHEQNEPHQWGWRKAIQLHLMHLLLLIFRRDSNKQAEEPEQRFITRSAVPLSQIMKCLNRMWRSPCTLDAIADELHMSKYYLCHYFKREVGMSIQQYLMQRKVNEAMRLLLQTHLTMKEVGYQAGFQTPSHFSKKFKEELGQTPEQFRKKARKW